MEFAFITTALLLIAFGVLGIFDGVYLHLIKYRLYNHPESRMEHLTHTIRMIFFPPILYFLYMGNDNNSFIVGLVLVLADIIVLGLDAYLEGDSRKFMGGLPRWEYIIHLFVNGFHFAAVAVFLVIKVDLSGGHFDIRNNLSDLPGYSVMLFVAKNFIPGSIVFAALHVLGLFKSGAAWLNAINDRLLSRKTISEQVK
ncbi:hypothetical protein [Chitinophaga defluvii]|uniref:Uncharacterized protein n=1 Tax=Chitinophaga defluvii TaxID=3163343 RepID=A0ABV2T459_9BACT